MNLIEEPRYEISRTINTLRLRYINSADAAERKATGQHRRAQRHSPEHHRRHNGMGYRTRRAATPYLWSFSRRYSKGKFVRDGHYDPNAVSKQCSAALMLKAVAPVGGRALCRRGAPR